ncbi:hypothetical protein F4823DRAFT_594621 [Ustulina deusta]|nr:hypothetical protein F4823DRAFT_594621 [Ustulina deusta]
MSTASNKKYPTLQQTNAAVQAVAGALGNTHYAIVGGAACTMLGSVRLTEDVDFVVPKGETKAARALLKQKETYFSIDKRTQHTTYRSEPNIEVEILTPPALFKEEFTARTPTYDVGGVRVLKPALLLNAKCGSLLGRATDDKKRTDSRDINFLLQWCASHRQFPSTAEMSNATPAFVQYYIGTFGGEQHWKDAGYNIREGRWSH